MLIRVLKVRGSELKPATIISDAAKTARHQSQRIGHLISRPVQHWLPALFGRPNLARSSARRARGRSIPIGHLNCFENFYDLETGSGQSWRWTGPNPNFAIFVTTGRETPTRVSLEVLHSQSAINWHNTFMECDGVMALCDHRISSGRHYLEGVIPAKSGASSAMIRYHVQETRKPPEGNDNRLLGLRVLALVIG